MHSMRMFFCAATVLMGTFVLAGPTTTAPAGTTPEQLLRTQLEVAAIGTISDLQLTTEQLKQLRQMTENPAGDFPSPADSVDPEYDAALNALHDALLSDDTDRIAAAKVRASELESKLKIDLPSPDLTDAALKRANDVLRLLTPHQFAGYIARNAETVVDCDALLRDAIDKSHDLSKEKFVALRDRVAGEISALVAFTPPDSPKPPIFEKIVKLLDHVHGMTHDSLQDQRGAVDDDFAALVTKIGPTQGVKNWMDHRMAELLSNPQIHPAIDQYRKAVASKNN